MTRATGASFTPAAAPVPLHGPAVPVGGSGAACTGVMSGRGVCSWGLLVGSARGVMTSCWVVGLVVRSGRGVRRGPVRVGAGRPQRTSASEPVGLSGQPMLCCSGEVAPGGVQDGPASGFGGAEQLGHGADRGLLIFGCEHHRGDLLCPPDRGELRLQDLQREIDRLTIHSLIVTKVMPQDFGDSSASGHRDCRCVRTSVTVAELSRCRPPATARPARDDHEV